MFSFTMNIYLGDVVSKDVLKSFSNLLQGGHETSTKKLDEVGKVCIRAKWPIRPELIPVSIA